MKKGVFTTDIDKSGQLLWQELKKDIGYLSAQDQQIVELAFTQMMMAHGQDRRRSGEFYVIHPVRACQSLAKIRMDVATLAATLLHDVPEDTSVTLRDLSRDFDPEIIFLIEGVTKLSKVKYQGEERYAENLRKMFVAMGQDLRVIIIKLADRLHNLQTLKFVRPEKQYRIALESLEIYAPIAERLGISSLQNAIEDAAFPYVHRDIYHSFIHDSDLEINRRNRTLERILKRTKKVLEDNFIEPEKIYGRSKKYYSIYKKMLGNKTDLKNLHDLVAIRIIAHSLEDCYFILSCLQQNFDILPHRIKDYIARPKPNGYQSLHLTGFDETSETYFEFQIRTRDMHEFAEYGVAAHFAYKAKQRKQELSQFLSGENLKWIKELVDIGKQELSAEEYLKKVKLDLFQDRIFVITPNNDAIDLPKGSTPLDFAFRIHVEIGLHATMAKINGQIARLGDELHNGDIVEIMTDKRQKPRPDWLKWVKTRNARSHIRGYMRKTVQAV